MDRRVEMHKNVSGQNSAFATYTTSSAEIPYREVASFGPNAVELPFTGITGVEDCCDRAMLADPNLYAAGIFSDIDPLTMTSSPKRCFKSTFFTWTNDESASSVPGAAQTQFATAEFPRTGRITGKFRRNSLKRPTTTRNRRLWSLFLQVTIFGED